MKNQSKAEDRAWQHWLWFKKGLLMFVLSVLFILAGARWQPLLQLPGLLLLVAALIYAIKGYMGILRYRLTSAFNPKKPK